MTIGNIELLKNISLNPSTDKNTKAIAGSNDTFEKFYQAALNIVNETNAYQQQATQTQLDFVTGRTDDILAVMMAQEKAYSSLQFTVQVTNKIVEAYREIMRIQL